MLAELDPPKAAPKPMATQPAAQPADVFDLTEAMTAPLPKPKARKVAISRVRVDTELYMVLSAPKIAPTAIKEAIKMPRVVMRVVSIVDWSAK